MPTHLPRGRRPQSVRAYEPLGAPPLFRHERLCLAHDAGHCATLAVQSISAALPASPKGPRLRLLRLVRPSWQLQRIG